jgi:Flp pilus assembly protein TadD
LLTLFGQEAVFRAQGAAEVPGVEAALAAAAPGDPVVLPFGALQCLERTAEALADGGFILVNDYGPTRKTPAGARAVSQRFGTTTALGVNFPLVEARLAEAGLTVTAPSADEERTLHTRLVTRQPRAGLLNTLEARFGSAGRSEVERPLAEARAALAAGRLDDSRAAFSRVIAASPRDWWAIGQAAELSKAAGDFQQALRLSEAGLALNPCYSGWLWNLRGETLYCLGRFAEAHGAFVEARGIDARDARTNTNLAYTYTELGDCTAALEAIARALAADRKGVFRERLRRKQDHVLMVLASREAGEQLRLMNRAGHLAQPWTPGPADGTTTAAPAVACDSAAGGGE